MAISEFVIEALLLVVNTATKMEGNLIRIWLQNLLLNTRVCIVVFSRQYQAVFVSDVMYCDCSVRWAGREASRSANLYRALRRHWND
jgi:hypothetical protein